MHYYKMVHRIQIILLFCFINCQEIKRTPKEDMPTQAIVRIIGAKKPGLKDNNFQVLNSICGV